MAKAVSDGHNDEGIGASAVVSIKVGRRHGWVDVKACDHLGGGELGV